MPRSHWPRRLPKRYATKHFLTSRDLSDIAHVSRIAINRYWIRYFPNAQKLGEHANGPWAVPTEDVIDFLKNLKKKSEPTTSP